MKMTRKSLSGIILLVGAVVVMAGIWSPIQAQTKADKAAAAQEELQKHADNGQLKTVAMDNLLTFQSRTRKKFRGYCDLMTDYIKKELGKTEEYRNAGLKVTVTPAGVLEAVGKTNDAKDLKVKIPDKPITFDEAFELAIEITKTRGHMVIDVSGTEETEMAQRVYLAKAKLTRKVWTETQTLYKRALSMKAYLDSIKEFEKCKLWAQAKVASDKKARKYARDSKARAYKAMQAEKHAERVAVGKVAKERDRKEMEAAKARRLMLADERRKRNFELTQQRIDSDTKIREAKYKGRSGYGGDNWW
jgi:hypothetical protein